LSVRRVVEADVCIVGSGITAALVAEKLTEERAVRVVVVEAGDETVGVEPRFDLRRRFLEYGENPWPNDHVDGMTAAGIQSRSMQVGGLAMHWGGVTPRFSPEDFQVRSLYGVGNDWPLTYDDLVPFYDEAERRMGVAGEAGPPDLDARRQPYPLPALPLSYNLERLRAWAEHAGIPTWSQPSAKNSVPYGGRPACCRNDTCFPICPIGAKYTPDYTWRALREAGRVELITRTVIRRLVPAAGSSRIERAIGIDRRDFDNEIEFRASTFVVAAGYVWSSHLLLLSATGDFPNGMANSSGLVGKYMTGHRNVSAFIKLPMKLYPGINTQHSLLSTKFMRPSSMPRYIRHDFRIWESTYGVEARMRDDDGRLLLGDAILADWRQRAEHGTARVRSYYDVIPHRESAITLDDAERTPWGDPLPRIRFRDSDVSAALKAETEAKIEALFRELAASGGGTVLRSGSSDFQDHPSGGCRMGHDPTTSVCDSFGRTHDHENLFVVGAPTCVSGGCANGTLTFVALGLRSAGAIGASFSPR
jgi:glucose dehydrogenase